MTALVSVDARWLQRAPLGGVGRGLAGVLPLVAAEVDLHLLTDAARAPVDSPLPQTPLPTPWPGWAALWLQLSAPRHLARAGGIFHCPFYWLPERQPVPMVVTLHDLTFEHRPEWFTRGQRTAFRRMARHAARTAAVVLVPSRHVADDVRETYGVPAGRLLVAPHGADPVFRPGLDATALLDRLGVRGPYVVALGGARRRGLDRAVAAWRQVPEAGALVVVGAAPAEPGVVAAGALPDDDLAALLAQARALLYPTAYEGFGLPALEAAACGTPVVCARVGALPEVLGEAAAWSASLQPVDLAAALRRALTAGDDLRAAGPARVAGAPGWSASADAHLEAYRRAAA